jgi:hypothetical protein
MNLNEGQCISYAILSSLKQELGKGHKFHQGRAHVSLCETLGVVCSLTPDAVVESVSLSAHMRPNIVVMLLVDGTDFHYMLSGNCDFPSCCFA